MSNNGIKNLNGFIKEKNAFEESIKFYTDKLQSKEIINMEFSMADTIGNLYFYENDIRVQLSNTDIRGKIYEPRYRSIALAKTYPVVVTSVDREKKEVNVSHFEAKTTTKADLINEIEEAIQKNEPLTVVSRVIAITGKTKGKYCIIDIGGVGITGIIKISDWSKAYTDNFRFVTRRGDIVKVVIMRKGRWNNQPVYYCSRAAAMEEDPWKGIEEKLPKNTTVNVTCLTKTEKNFFGKIDGIDEISAYCEYPDAERNIFISEGKKYQGYVVAVSEETKLLRVRIFKALEK